MTITKATKVTYRAYNGSICTAHLQNATWHTVRGVRVLRGKQQINGRLVNRSLAENEILSGAPNA